MGNGLLALARVNTWALAALLAGAIAAPASAEWRVYTSADLGFSIAEADGSGRINSAAPLTFTLGGDDNDVSPFLGGAIGLAVPFGEATPWTLPRWLSKFRLREEVEVVGLRNYKFTTDQPELNGMPVVLSGKVQTELDMWSVMVNTWLDIPLDGLYRPISWTSARLFGRWRLASLKRVLERTTISGGVGIGATFLDIDTAQDGTKGDDNSDDFAWQALAGIGYQLSDRVNLSLGYRYIDPGSVKFTLREDGASNGSFFKLDPEIHEARASIRVDVFGFTSPWR
jgi:hypothetical protein